MHEKQHLRAWMRNLRRAYIAALPEASRSLILMRPPTPVTALMPEGSVVGLYHAAPAEAPTRGYAQWLYENGRRIALPWFATRDGAMTFREWSDPFGDSDLEHGPYGPQPHVDAAKVPLGAVVVPLLAFTLRGARLGQGGGHYDRWLAENPEVLPIGLAWDMQLVEDIPLESHDRRLSAVVTPTRFYDCQD